jgi:hypothetical protein
MLAHSSKIKYKLKVAEAKVFQFGYDLLSHRYIGTLQYLRLGV